MCPFSLSANIMFHFQYKLFFVACGSRFKDIFQEVYEQNWKVKFEEQSIWLGCVLIFI